MQKCSIQATKFELGALNFKLRVPSIVLETHVDTVEIKFAISPDSSG